MTASLDEALAQARALLGAAATTDAPLGARTTYKVGGTASLLVEAHSADDLTGIAEVVRSTGVPVLVVGRGSNLLVSDRGYRGLVVVLGERFETIVLDGDLVVAGGAVRLPVLARTTASAGRRGLEWMVGVPGSVGGAVRMNAGGHGSDVAASLVGVRVVDLATGEDGFMRAGSLGLSFRRSSLSDVQVVVEAHLRTTRGDADDALAEIDAIVQWRRAHQPGGRNAGSVFVNPLPESAGAIIDRLGLRGLRIGTAEVSTKHANFIQADDGGAADDVHRLIEHVRSEVRRATGIELRSEIRLVGFEADEEVVR